MDKYIMNEGERAYKTPKAPNISDYYDINETEEERAERIYLYSEVKDSE